MNSTKNKDSFDFNTLEFKVSQKKEKNSFRMEKDTKIIYFLTQVLLLDFEIGFTNMDLRSFQKSVTLKVGYGWFFIIMRRRSW